MALYLIFVPKVNSTTDYYPFGMAIVERTWQSKEYRYGFNTQEKDLDIDKSGNHTTAEFWEYDSRSGRRWNVDPVVKEYESGYACFSNNPISLNDIKGNDAEPILPFKKGTYFGNKPKFNYDNGFLGAVPEIGYVPKSREAGVGDYLSYTWWGAKLAGSYVFRWGSASWTLYDANKAYYHFRNGEGSKYYFNLSKYFENDASGQITKANAIDIAKESASILLPHAGSIPMVSQGFSGGSGDDARFPYPATENWQKAIGAYNFWMNAEVKAEEVNGFLHYTMTLTFNAEDKYNFNPGQEDIATGTPDSANGNFELTSLGHQFMQYGLYTEVIKWTKKITKETTTKDEKPK
jgi:hypothetical protein